MKIVYLADCVIPSRTANSIQVMRMCQAFATLHHDVTLLIPAVPDRRIEGAEPGVDDVFAFYGVSPVFRIARFPNRYLHRHLTALAMGVRARFMKPDRVYGRQIVASMTSAALSQDTTLELHEPTDASAARSAVTRLLSWLPGMRGVVVISDSLRRHMETRHPRLRGRVLTAHDGADPVPAVAPVSLKPAESFHVGYVGHLYPGKAMELIRLVAPLCPWAQFHMVGGRSQDIALWRERTAGQSNLTFHGFQSPTRLPAYLSAFDVVIAPFQSKVVGSSGRVDTARWMSPLKVFEYMSARRAIICSDLPVLREVLEHGRTAVLCDPEKPEEWAEALGRLRADEALRRRLGTSAGVEFDARFTWLKRAERLSRALEGVDAWDVS